MILGQSVYQYVALHQPRSAASHAAAEICQVHGYCELTASIASDSDAEFSKLL